MIKAIISDFDGTLVDTYGANLKAYQASFQELGLELPAETYRACFGLRFDDFMKSVGVSDARIVHQIKELKKQYYPRFFDELRPNAPLLQLIRSCRAMGMRTAVASTARRENLMNALTYMGAGEDFDLIYAGMDVKKGKPDPEIYIHTMKALGVSPEETLIFEDSDVGVRAASASGAHCIKVSL